MISLKDLDKLFEKKDSVSKKEINEFWYNQSLLSAENNCMNWFVKCERCGRDFNEENTTFNSQDRSFICKDCELKE